LSPVSVSPLHSAILLLLEPYRYRAADIIAAAMIAFVIHRLRVVMHVMLVYWCRAIAMGVIGVMPVVFVVVPPIVSAVPVLLMAIVFAVAAIAMISCISCGAGQ